MARVVVLGGGYAGLACLIELSKKDKSLELHLLDASRMALEAGAPLTANMILLGFSMGRLAFPFSYETVRATVKNLSKKPYREQNLKALASGYEAGSSG